MAKWLDGSYVEIITSGLDALATNVGAASPAVDNSTDELLYADIQIYIAGFGNTVENGARVADVYLIPTIDGTTYPDGHDASTTPNTRFRVGAAWKATSSGAGAVRDGIFGVPLPARNFKVVLINRAGQTFAGSGNIVGIRRFRTQ